jgi:hypothetical protein
MSIHNYKPAGRLRIMFDEKTVDLSDFTDYSDQIDYEIDVAPSHLGIGAQLVRSMHDGLGDFLFEPRQADVEAGLQDVCTVHHFAQVHFRVDRRPGLEATWARPMRRWSSILFLPEARFTKFAIVRNGAEKTHLLPVHFLKTPMNRRIFLPLGIIQHQPSIHF